MGDHNKSDIKKDKNEMQIMVEETVDKNSKVDNSLTLGNLLIILVLSFSIIFDHLSIYTAFLLAILIWLVFSDVLTIVKDKLQEKSRILEQGGQLYQHCKMCGLRYSISREQCPKCEESIE